MPTTLSTAKPSRPRSVWLTTLVFSFAILVLWSFPHFWYSKTDPRQGYYWLAERTGLAGWSYTNQPLSDAAEAALAADRIVNGEFVQQPASGEGAVPTAIRVFSAKRYSAKESEFDMFSHTPDRCWTSVGWKVEPATPEFVDLNVHGLAIRFERRIFTRGGHRELAYFGALVGGQPLPYRLDQYLDIGVRRGERPQTGIFGKVLGAIDARFFSWPWKSFVNRRPLNGPKQFIRISTSVAAGAVEEADATLAGFLSEWLELADYEKELQQWRKLQAHAERDAQPQMNTDGHR